MGLRDAQIEDLGRELEDSRFNVMVVDTSFVHDASGSEDVELRLMNRNAISFSDSCTIELKVTIESLPVKVGETEGERTELLRHCDAQVDRKARAILNMKKIIEDDLKKQENELDFEAIELVMASDLREKDEVIRIFLQSSEGARRTDYESAGTVSKQNALEDSSAYCPFPTFSQCKEA